MKNWIKVRLMRGNNFQFFGKDQIKIWMKVFLRRLQFWALLSPFISVLSSFFSSSVLWMVITFRVIFLIALCLSVRLLEVIFVSKVLRKKTRLSDCKTAPKQIWLFCKKNIQKFFLFSFTFVFLWNKNEQIPQYIEWFSWKISVKNEG